MYEATWEAENAVLIDSVVGQGNCS